MNDDCLIWEIHLHSIISNTLSYKFATLPYHNFHSRSISLTSFDVSFLCQTVKKLNCWEFKKCGREQGGKHQDDLGVCPAVQEKRLAGAHDGQNAGRSCWVVAGTLCGGKVQGTFAKKYEHCENCDFYKLVRQEEGSQYRYSIQLLGKLKGNQPVQRS
jgi:hypothetical protein